MCCACKKFLKAPKKKGLIAEWDTFLGYFLAPVDCILKDCWTCKQHSKVDAVYLRCRWHCVDLLVRNSAQAEISGIDFERQFYQVPQVGNRHSGVLQISQAEGHSLMLCRSWGNFSAGEMCWMCHVKCWQQVLSEVCFVQAFMSSTHAHVHWKIEGNCEEQLCWAE